MPDENTQSGGTGSADGSAESNNSKNQRTIDPKDHDNAIKDMLRYKSQVGESNARIAALEKQLEEIKTTELKGKEDYKSLYEGMQEKYQSLETTHNKFKEGFIYEKKYNAAKEELMKAGLKKEALKILDREPLEQLKVEATSEGRFLVHGADLYVDHFKKEHPYAFQAANPDRINSGGGNGGGNFDASKVTADDVIKLERQWRKSGKAEDEKNYRQAVVAYSKQRAAPGNQTRV